MQKQGTRQPNMLAWALRYAELGFHVLPCHEPLFDHPDGYRCTCEVYRHKDRCKADDVNRKARGQAALYLAPGEHCVNPGKHPRGAEHGLKDATTDAATIRKWWQKYPNANIAHVPGRAGFVMLDGDSYKEHYAGADMLTSGEQETPTVISGNGGEHLYYAKHPGATYTNAPGSLPAGVDVRGDSGYALLPPSMHASGHRYQWEAGYEPGKIAPQLLPDRIHAILMAAAQTQRSVQAGPKLALEVTGPAPDLAAWRLSEGIQERILHPAPRGQRSEADWSVILALLNAGATPDEIHAVFCHYPIGAGGKFAERGVEYLERTIAKAGTFLEAHPPPSHDELNARNAAKALAMAQAVGVVQWVRTAQFGEFVPVRYHSERGYMTANSDKRLAVALAKMAYDQGQIDGFMASFQSLGVRAGMSTSTVSKALPRLEGWFVTVERPEHAAWRYSLAKEVIAAGIDCCKIEQYLDLSDNSTTTDPCGNTTVRSCNISAIPLVSHAGADIFSRTLSALTPEQLAERNAKRAEIRTAALCEAAILRAKVDRDPVETARLEALEKLAARNAPMKETRELKRRLAAAVGSVGPGALRVVDALYDAPDQRLDRDALSEGLHMSRQTIWRHCKRLEQLGLVATDGAGVQLLSDWQEMTETLSPVCANAGSDRRRRIARLTGIIFKCNALLKTAKPDARDEINRRLERAKRQLQLLASEEMPALRQDPARLGNIVSQGAHRQPRWTDAQATQARMERLRTLARVHEHDPESRQDNSGQWKRGELAAVRAAAGDDWDAYNDYMAEKHGQGWWAQKGQRGVLLGFKEYQASIAHDRTWAEQADMEV